MNQEQQRQLNDLVEFMNQLKSSTSIPLDVQRAFEERLFDRLLQPSSETGHTKQVSEGGSATYNVADAPTGFLRIIKNGTVVFVPYY